MAEPEQIASYTLSLHCQNCGDVDDYEIQKGIRVSTIECDNCGIKSLRRENWVNIKDRNNYLHSGMEDAEENDDV